MRGVDGAAPGRQAGQKRELRLSVSRCGGNGIRPLSIRAPSNSSAAGRTVTEPATAHAMTVIVPLAIPLKMSTEREHARHRDRIMVPERGPCAGTSGRCVERFMRGQAAMTFLARADHIEERVVDAHGHSDQEDDRLHAVVERECLADEPEEYESLDGRQGEQDRHESRDDGAERKEEDDQRDGIETAPHGAGRSSSRGLCVARSDVPRISSIVTVGMGRSGGQDRAPKRSERLEAPDDACDQNGMAVRRDVHDRCAAQSPLRPVA